VEVLLLECANVGCRGLVDDDVSRTGGVGVSADVTRKERRHVASTIRSDDVSTRVRSSRDICGDVINLVARRGVDPTVAGGIVRRHVRS
jgi:hypothetical protein